ncbi:MAG: hypothetical protein Q9182_001394 [Xanthomendoza sp. 2 TL-2023]
MQEVARPTPMTGRRTSAIDFAPIGEHTKRYSPFNHQEHQPRASTSTLNGADMSANQEGISSESDGADGNQLDSADADDAGANMEDPDVFAPSDMNIYPSQGQTGPPKSIHKTEKDDKEPSEALRDIANFDCSSEKAVFSDDDDYDGVDLISESGEEAPAPASLRERALIDWDDDNLFGGHPVSPPNTPTCAFVTDPTEIGQVDFSIDPFLTDDIFFKEQINLLDPVASAADDIGFFGSANDSPFTTSLAETPRRRVRFAEPLKLPSGDSKPLLPNLLKADASSARLCEKSSSTDKLNPAASDCDSNDHQTVAEGEGIGLEAGNDGGFSSETFESMDDEDDGNDCEGSLGSSSGYETDEGETTDEEDVPACATTRPSAVLHDFSASALNNGLAGQPQPQTPTPKLPPGRQWGPTLGSWVTDPTKSMAVVSSSGKELIIRPAQRPPSRGVKGFQSVLNSGQSSVQASPRPSVANMARPSYPNATDDSDMDRSEISNQEMATPMLSASPNVMMSGLAFGNGNLLSGHAMGPPQAFFPFQSIEADGQMVLDGLDLNYDDDDDDDDGEDILNIEDFIDFGEDTDDSDREIESTAGSSQSPALTSPSEAAAKTTSVPSFPSQPSFLDHLDKVAVTAFRRNQYNHEKTPFRQPGKSPFRAVNAIQGNSFLASNTPSGSSKKRKLTGGLGAPLGQNHAFTKRRMLNRH